MRTRKSRLWKSQRPLPGSGTAEPATASAYWVDGRVQPTPRRNDLGKTLLGMGAFGARRPESPHSSVIELPPVVRIQTVVPMPQPEAAKGDAPQAPPAPERSEISDESPALPGRRRWFYRGGTALLAVLSVALGTGAYQHANMTEVTDDAQIDAEITSVSARVPGTLHAVHVDAHQTVEAGELLAELDPKDFELAVSAAKANLARAEAALHADQPSLAIAVSGDDAAQTSARAELASAQSALDVALSEVKRLNANLDDANAQFRLAASEQERAQYLVKTGALSQAALDASDRAVESTRANADALRHTLGVTSAHINQRRADIAAAQARLRELQQNSPRRLESRRAALAATQANWELAKTQLEQAEAQLSYAKIYAPVSGIIGDKVANIGEALAPSQQVLAICRSETQWVTANFRETQLRNMRPGQRAEVYVDALDQTFVGHVESIAGATGSRFSLLPPENASGNYVKVVQRIPVKIRLDPGQAGLDRLRAGMSVEPSVLVR